MMLVIILFACLALGGAAQLEENDACETEHYKGNCAASRNCPQLPASMNAMGLTSNDIGHCGFTVIEDIICCPKSAVTSTTTAKPSDITTTAPLPGNVSTGSRNLVRPADRACSKIEKGLIPSSINRIIMCGPLAFPEYPHMAKIVYDVEDMACGGTLIDKRFVLTAAHCIITRDMKPIKVILGVTDFNDTEQWQGRLEIDIKATYVPQNYSSFSHYFDIGLIELASDAVFSVKVYPICLHTDPTDLPENTEIIETGWRSTEIYSLSKHLMAAKMNLIPLPECNAKLEYYIDRRLRHGIDETQLCALAPGKDACWGDSGGPLQIINDKAYTVVGVVSLGGGCGKNVPGIYTSVPKFLDFIESIVWPEG
ncbi:serine protease persephone-like [Anastrepha obliqua]|uniref:serine protease persephone-like n=1 Tax=Anastrepha obliqua TaxID=95512 RepID=UPI00240A73C8|nr:serine protease persephone-like [Anastrepha obliqua]